MKMTKSAPQQPFCELKGGLLQLLQDKSYGKNTINNYRRKLNQLERYMTANGVADYEPFVGRGFIDDYLTTHTLGRGNRQFIHTVIRRLDDYRIDDYHIQRRAERLSLPQVSTTFMEAYLQKSREDGNRESTISSKETFLREFFSNLISLGFFDLRNTDAAVIGKACLMQHNKDGWAVIRMFLRYLNSSGLVDRDFSGIVPHYRRGFRLPTTYTEEEIKRFEDAIDITTKTGKRDSAMLLLATRLGMRSGDIANLVFSELDLKGNAIRIAQEKTEEPLVLPIIPAVRAAIDDYLANGRPESSLPYVFLRMNAPFEKITTSVLRYETSEYFRKAKIDIAEKKHGPHVFRSSMASSMVNHSTPYDVIRKILGHTDPNAVKHYAKVDIERLREYAIEPPAPSGSFMRFLEGRSL